jgi:hypothetical protein
VIAELPPAVAEIIGAERLYARQAGYTESA